MTTVLELEVQVLVQAEVHTCAVHVVAAVCSAMGAELIPLEVEFEPVGVVRV